MIALVTLVVVFILAIGMLALSNSARLNGKRQIRHSGALTMANAGIEYGFWKVYYQGAGIPATFNYNSSNGYPLKFTVTVTDNSASVAGTVKIVSTGTQNGESRKVTRIMPSPTVFSYALCSNVGISGSDPFVFGSGGVNGSIRANGDISFSNSSTVINGNATTSTNSISVPSITGTQTINAPSLAFPAISTSYYFGIADVIYLSNQTWSGFTFTIPNEVVYVSGNVTLKAGTYSGTGTIVATGLITVQGNTSYNFSTDKVAFVTATGFNCPPVCSVVGIYYANGPSGTIGFHVGGAGGVTVTCGSVAAQNCKLDSFLNITYDPSMNATLGKQMHLPGY